MEQPHLPSGLSKTEAQKRLRQFGPNAVNLKKPAPLFVQFLATFKNPLIILLFVTSSVSLYFGDKRSFFTIVSMILLSSLLDFYNTYKSDRAAQKLKDKIRLTAAVIREGHEIEVPLEEIVPGDAVLVRVGDIIPADGTILEAKHCYTNEASLTGESFPVAKNVKDPIYMGSSISTGEAIMEVTATGTQTKFNHIVANLSKHELPTEFDREIKDFSFLIIKATAFLVLFVFVVNSLGKGNYLEAFMFGIALAVGMTPEMMPMIITINLSRGSLAMAKKGVIVKRLSAIQNFGSMDLLCTDKTGTLTEDSIALVKYVDAHGAESETVLEYGYINSVFSAGFRSPLDEAIKEYKHLSLKGYRKIDEIPFDFERRREAVVVDHDGKALMICKGAPESIFAICTHAHKKGHRFDEATLTAARATYAKLSRGGFRVLAIASGDVETQTSYTAKDEKNLTFIGLLAFLDPPKLTVNKTLKQMQEYGIAIKIITGDNELVSQRIAQEIEMPVTGILLGSEIDELTDTELVTKAHGVNLFARVNPDQKLRIISTMQKHGHVVGYIGDGINDAPSLKAADVGISVNNATDIAKESADLIMVRKDLDDLILAVIEGRKTFVNTMKYLMMTLSSNFGNMFSMAGASVFLPFLPMLPSQVLFNNLLYDSSQFTLPADNVDEADLKRPKKLHISVVRKFMVIIGPISSIFDFLTFFLLFSLFHLPEHQFQTGWFMESLATQVFVVYIIRTKLVPFLESRPSRYLVAGTVGVVIIGWFFGITTAGKLFNFAPVPGIALWAIAGLVVIYLFLVELVKRRFYQMMANRPEFAGM